jgi:cysteine desulfuration protein SufE
VTINLEEIQQEIIDEFEIFDDWMDRYNYLIELSKDLPMIDTRHRSNEYIIKGCQSKVWLDAQLKDGKIIFTADSDAIITKGIVTLLIKVLSNRTPKEIMDAELTFIDKIGLRENLSPTRANGLLAMIKQMKLYAIAYNAKSQNDKL